MKLQLTNECDSVSLIQPGWLDARHLESEPMGEAGQVPNLEPGPVLPDSVVKLSTQSVGELFPECVERVFE
jgi:hypothetical protein